MAEDREQEGEMLGSEDDGEQSKLELPSLRLFGRRKKKERAEEPVQADTVEPAEPAAEPTAPDPVEPPGSETRTLPVVEDEPPAGASPGPSAGPAPTQDRERRMPPGPPPAHPASEEATADPVPTPATEPATEPVPEPVPEPAEPIVEPAPEPVAPEPAPTTEPEPEPAHASVAEPTLDEPVDDTTSADAAYEEQSFEDEPVDQPVGARDDAGRSLLESLRLGRQETGSGPAEQEERPPRSRGSRRRRRAEPQPEPEAEPTAERERAARKPARLPRLNPYPVALVTGVIVGVVGVALTIGTGRGCEAVRGVGSCGGFGLFAMVVILAIQVILGATLLRAFRLPDSSSTSFLGVGLAAVVVLLFFLPVLDSLWMFLVIPALTAATMAFSWWLTSNFVERPQDDLRGSNLD